MYRINLLISLIIFMISNHSNSEVLWQLLLTTSDKEVIDVTGPTDTQWYELKHGWSCSVRDHKRNTEVEAGKKIDDVSRNLVCKRADAQVSTGLLCLEDEHSDKNTVSISLEPKYLNHPQTVILRCQNCPDCKEKKKKQPNGK